MINGVMKVNIKWDAMRNDIWLKVWNCALNLVSDNKIDSEVYVGVWYGVESHIGELLDIMKDQLDDQFNETE